MDSFSDRDDTVLRFGWLPPALRPPVAMARREARMFALVGAAAIFGGYDLGVYSLALQQIQTSLHIPENLLAPTVAYFRLASIAALAIAYCADLVGRRRLLLITIFGQALATLATGFAATYHQFVWLQIATRTFGYAEEMLCVVVIVEEIATGLRGWATGTLGALAAIGTGIATLVLGFVNLLPYGWRAIYVIGAIPIFIIAFLRRGLAETRRFELRRQEARSVATRLDQAFDVLRRLAQEYPSRLIPVLIAVAAYGFASGASLILAIKYLEQSHGYSPPTVSALTLVSGLIAISAAVGAGRLSDRIGRKPVVIVSALALILGFGIFFSGVGGWLLPLAWVAALSGNYTTDSQLSAYAIELVPTAYRATVSGLRYALQVLSGALALALEGVFYGWFGAHGPAIELLLAAGPVIILAVLFLPEPAGRSLEEIAGEASAAVDERPER